MKITIFFVVLMVIFFSDIIYSFWDEIKTVVINIRKSGYEEQVRMLLICVAPYNVYAYHREGYKFLSVIIVVFVLW